jgi:predicted nucleic-acid-binding Zn-ribbon protein
MMIKVQCEKCGGTLAKWDSIGLDWVMYCINCGTEFYTREPELKEQWQAAMALGKRSFVLRPRIMTSSRR